MKNLLLVAGFLLIALNTVIGLLLSVYSSFNFLLVDFCLLTTTILIYIFSNSNIADGFKIGLTLLFAVLGFMKVICGMFAPQIYTDNLFIIFLLLIFGFEALCVITAFAMKKFS